MKLMSETLSGGDAEGAGDDEFMPMMQGMMKNLLSKDILYPSLKEISTKVGFYIFLLLVIIQSLYANFFITIVC